MYHRTAVGMIGLAVIIFASFALVGHLIGDRVYCTWGRYGAGLSVPTAVCFILCGIAFLVISFWHKRGCL